MARACDWDGGLGMEMALVLVMAGAKAVARAMALAIDLAAVIVLNICFSMRDTMVQEMVLAFAKKL